MINKNFRFHIHLKTAITFSRLQVTDSTVILIQDYLTTVSCIFKHKTGNVRECFKSIGSNRKERHLLTTLCTRTEALTPQISTHDKNGFLRNYMIC